MISRRCTHCLLPDTYPGVTFDEEGVCNHCLSYAKPELLGVQDLLEQFRPQEDAEFDCVVGISGGKDSCYVAYLATQLGLRPLAVTYDFEFVVDLARRNARTVCDHLGIELLTVQSHGAIERDLIRNHLMSLAATGTTWGQCMFCHYGIEAVLYGVARAKRIPLILSGITEAETWWNPGRRMGYLTARVRELSLKERSTFCRYQSKAYCALVAQRRQFPLPGNSAVRAYDQVRAPHDGPRVIRIFDYVEWDQDVIERTLTAEAGWTKPDGRSSWRYDCLLEPLLDYTYLREFGISSCGLYLSGLVRSGKMSRDLALSELLTAEDPARLREHFAAVMSGLEMPAAVQRAFLAPLEGL